MHNILVVDDDPTVAEVVTGYLERAGFTVDRAADGPQALRLAAGRRPDLVVLDLMLPGMDGLEVCRRLRTGELGRVPVIMLTARGDEDDRILGLEIGADDYVTKPFSPRELVLRVESVLRRGAGGTGERRPGPELSAAGIVLDPAARRAVKDGRELALTLREFDLLAHLIRHPGEAIGRERLMQEVWGWEFGDLSTVTVHVRRLRGKIEDDPARPRLIQTVWGVGYRFDVPDDEEPAKTPAGARPEPAPPAAGTRPGSGQARSGVVPGDEPPQGHAPPGDQHPGTVGGGRDARGMPSGRVRPGAGTRAAPRPGSGTRSGGARPAGVTGGDPAASSAGHASHGDAPSGPSGGAAPYGSTGSTASGGAVPAGPGGPDPEGRGARGEG